MRLALDLQGGGDTDVEHCKVDFATAESIPYVELMLRNGGMTPWNKTWLTEKGGHSAFGYAKHGGTAYLRAYDQGNAQFCTTKRDGGTEDFRLAVTIGDTAELRVYVDENDGDVQATLRGLPAGAYAIAKDESGMTYSAPGTVARLNVTSSLPSKDHIFGRTIGYMAVDAREVPARLTWSDSQVDDRRTVRISSHSERLGRLSISVALAGPLLPREHPSFQLHVDQLRVGELELSYGGRSSTGASGGALHLLYLDDARSTLFLHLKELSGGIVTTGSANTAIEGMRIQSGLPLVLTVAGKAHVRAAIGAMPPLLDAVFDSTDQNVLLAIVASEDVPFVEVVLAQAVRARIDSIPGQQAITARGILYDAFFVTLSAPPGVYVGGLTLGFRLQDTELFIRTGSTRAFMFQGDLDGVAWADSRPMFFGGRLDQTHGFIFEVCNHAIQQCIRFDGPNSRVLSAALILTLSDATTFGDQVRMVKTGLINVLPGAGLLRATFRSHGNAYHAPAEFFEASE